MGAAGYAPSDVKRILITHAHPDHVGGLPDLQAATGAEVICHQVEKPYVEGTENILRGGGNVGDPLPGTPVDRTLSDGEVIEEIEGGLQTIFTPGHAPGHASYWLPRHKVMFVGDVIWHFLGRMTLPMKMATPDMDANKRSSQKIAMLKPQIACFGHGPILMEDTAYKLRLFANQWTD